MDVCGKNIPGKRNTGSELGNSLAHRMNTSDKKLCGWARAFLMAQW